MIGQQLGHYRVLEKIGAGGMGEVYRARDKHLERDVAIKVLPAGTLADESARKRFRKEALALSKLNHPNIATVFDFDTQDGVDFLVMELVAGESLSEKLAGRPLPEKDVARIGAQLAEGLAAAHEDHVIHRDLKPGNLRLTPDGRLKILDFGLAKLIQPLSSSAPTASVTGTGIVAGTLPYMAPEQLRGEKADARSDVYSAGVVLYEIATGRRPFEQKLGSALAAAIVHELPPPPHQFNPQLSSRLQDTILKCLDKDPENRYQSAKELLVDLRRLATLSAFPIAPSPQAPAWGRSGSRWRVPPGSAWRVAIGLAGMVIVAGVLVGLNVGGVRERLFGTATPKIESLAVLPLDNLSGDPEQDYFVDGMHEALTAELSKISALKVISRTSAMHYKGTDKAMPQIARELGVDGLIEGSVVREGDQVRITVQLIHGPTDKHLWADSYQRELRGVLALQSEVAREIANQVRVTVTPQEQARLARARPVNPEAYRLYLLGRYHWNKRTPEGFQKAAEHFQQAIDLDPTYALAYAGLADNYAVQPSWGTLSPRDAYPRAKAAAQKALELDASLAEPYATLGYVLGTYEWDWEGAERAYRKALELNPNYATAHFWYALYLSAVGRHGEAIAEIKRAQELDPLSLIIAANEGRMYYFARQYNEAEGALRKALEMDPKFAETHANLGWIYLATGRPQEAVAAFHRALELLPTNSEYLAGLAEAYVLAGKREEARRLLERLEKESKERYVPASHIAFVYAHLGEKDRAFHWLEKSFEQRDFFLGYVKVDPRWDILRDDPRFQALLRRMNFPE